MTTVLYPYELTHLVQVVFTARAGYRAECTCGWAGPWTDELSASDSAVDHQQVAVGPPIGLDVAISGLLDLQDDLADTVMWLAENWSADFPTPRAISTSRSRENGDSIPGVRLLVYCESREELVPLAGLLDVPLVADPEPDSKGNRWERAIRRFGRVEIEAFRALDESGVAP